MNGYHYITMAVTDQWVHQSSTDVLALALDDLRKDAEQKGLPADMQTVIMPPKGHAQFSDAWRFGMWTVALTENPTDFARRLAGYDALG